MLPVGFEPTISAGERPQTYALDRAATGTGLIESLLFANSGQNTGYTDFVVDVLIPSRQTPGKIRIRTRLISSKYFPVYRPLLILSCMLLLSDTDSV